MSAERAATTRTMQGKGIAAMGLVSREGEVFKVKSPTLRGAPQIHDVWKDEAGTVRCSCDEFKAAFDLDPRFRCAHIFAVKSWLIMKQEGSAPEPSDTIQPAEAEGATVTEQLDTPFGKTLTALKRPIDPAMIRTREGWTDRQGNTHMVEYVEWHAVADILDMTCPGWSHAVKGMQVIGDTVAVIASITIDGVTREGVGTGTMDSEMGIKKAEHDALKRAAVKFGVARELYQRESEVIEKTGGGYRNTSVNEIRDPLAKSMADLVTPKQLGMLRALAREAGVDADEECMQVLQCKTEELSKRAASSLIDHLKNISGDASGTMRRAS